MCSEVDIYLLNRFGAGAPTRVPHHLHVAPRIEIFKRRSAWRWVVGAAARLFGRWRTADTHATAN
jgi:hypothetical protein